MKNELSHLVVTGATGYLGRHFLHWYMRHDTEVHVTVILRGSSVQVARARLQRLMSSVAESYGVAFDARTFARRCSIVLGDITLPSCGVSRADLESMRLRGNTAFWHLAASLNFEASRQDEIELHNIGGTIAAVDLACALNCSRFFYVSTAYTCGLAVGTIPERLHDRQGPFGNAYERSKCEAEHVMSEKCDAANLRYSIVRPSIVVGVSGAWVAAGGETGLFGFAREVLRAKRRIENQHGPIRIVGDSQAQVNLVPVDHVARQMVRMTHSNNGPSDVVHLVGKAGPTVSQAVDAITETVGVRSFQFVSELPPDAAPIERVLAKRLGFYQTYLRHSKRFAADGTSAPALTKGKVKQLVRSYLEERQSDRFAMVERTLTSRDGISLTIARNDRAPKLRKETVVVVNAVGMPNAALERLTTALSQTHDVLTWESRGASPAGPDLDHRAARFSAHADDLEDMLSQYDIERVHLIGWCTGADVCLDFLSRHPEQVLSLTCLNGAFVRMCTVRTPFQQDLEQIVRHVSRNPAHAKLYHTIMTNPSASGAERRIIDTGASIRTTISGVDGSLVHLTGAPLQSAELLARYCMLLEHYFDEAPSAVPHCGVPAFFGTAKNDEIAPFEASVQVAMNFSRSWLYFAACGGHFAPCTEDSLLREVADFLMSHSVRGDLRIAQAQCA